MGFREDLEARQWKTDSISIAGAVREVTCERGTPADLKRVGGDPFTAAVSAIAMSRTNVAAYDDPRVAEAQAKSPEGQVQEGTLIDLDTACRIMACKAPVYVVEDGERIPFTEELADSLDMTEAVALGLLVMEAYGVDVVAGGGEDETVRTFPEGQGAG